MNKINRKRSHLFGSLYLLELHGPMNWQQIDLFNNSYVPRIATDSGDAKKNTTLALPLRKLQWRTRQ